VIVIKKILQHDKPVENKKKFISKHNFRAKRKRYVLKTMKMKPPEKNKK
jgi:hypothetical protein